MIYPKRNIILKTILHSYVRWLTARHFRQINYNEITIDPKKAVLLVANHFSAWDAFVMFWLNRKLFKKQFHVLMLEKTVIKEPILKYAGAFSIAKKSKDMIQSLDFAATLLNNPDNLVLIFPQGKLYSNMVTEILFEKGLSRIIKKTTGEFELVYAATFIENFESFKPVANVHLKSAAIKDFLDISELQSAYQQHYTEARQLQIQTVI